MQLYRKIKLLKTIYKTTTRRPMLLVHDYKPIITMNGKSTHQIVRCYIMLPPYADELPLAPGQSWWQTLPPTQTRESNRNKRCQQSSITTSDNERAGEVLPGIVQSKPSEDNKMELYLTIVPWGSKRVHKLFLPSCDEHPKDAVACHIDILMDARCEPDGHKSIIEGGDEHNNCAKKDIITLMDKFMYSISALTAALHNFPKKNMERLL